MDYAFSRQAGWVRFGSRVFQYTFSHPFFSERYGFVLPIFRITIGKWTFAIIMRKDNGT